MNPNTGADSATRVQKDPFGAATGSVALLTLRKAGLLSGSSPRSSSVMTRQCFASNPSLNQGGSGKLPGNTGSRHRFFVTIVGSHTMKMDKLQSNSFKAVVETGYGSISSSWFEDAHKLVETVEDNVDTFRNKAKKLPDQEIVVQRSWEDLLGIMVLIIQNFSGINVCEGKEISVHKANPQFYGIVNGL